MEWGATDLHCLNFIASLRAENLAPATVQNYGALLRHLVTTAHRARWLPRTFDPMEDVPYTAAAARSGEGLYVEPKVRPSTEMVEALIGEFTKIGESDGRWWLGLLPDVAGFGGLRFGEQTAVRVRHYDAEHHGLRVTEAWKRVRGTSERLGPPKNGRARFVFLRGGIRDDLLRRVEEVRAALGDDGLLFPGPFGPTRPFSEGQLRSVFTRAGRDAGWELTGGGKTPKGQSKRPHPVIPYMNLRHHAACWMHAAGMSWEAVSAALGHHSVAFTLARYVRKHHGEDERTRSVLDRF